MQSSQSLLLAAKNDLEYFPETGVIKWKRNRGRGKVGEVAGTRHPAGYILIKIEGKNVPAHLVAAALMNGEWPAKTMDHENHIRSDNRWGNLRIVGQAVNAKNASLSMANKSGIAGVRWSEKWKKWVASIGVNYKDFTLGYYDSFLDACCARKSAELKHGFHANHGIQRQEDYMPSKKKRIKK